MLSMLSKAFQKLDVIKELPCPESHSKQKYIIMILREPKLSIRIQISQYFGDCLNIQFDLKSNLFWFYKIKILSYTPS